MQRKSSLNKHTPLNYFTKFKEQIEILQDEVDIYNTRENQINNFNDSGSLNYLTGTNGKKIMPNQQILKSNKKLLLKMTEPKYHKYVVTHLSEREKQWAAEKQTISKLIEKQNINLKKQSQASWLDNCLISDSSQNTNSRKGYFGKNPENKGQQEDKLCISKIVYSQGNVCKQNLHINLNQSMAIPSKLRISVLKKQKKLMRQWQKTQQYKNKNNISNQFQNTEVQFSQELPKKRRDKSKRQKYIIDKVKLNRPETCLTSYYSRVETDIDTITNSRGTALGCCEVLGKMR